MQRPAAVDQLVRVRIPLRVLACSASPKDEEELIRDDLPGAVRSGCSHDISPTINPAIAASDWSRGATPLSRSLS